MLQAEKNRKMYKRRRKIDIFISSLNSLLSNWNNVVHTNLRSGSYLGDNFTVRYFRKIYYLFGKYIRSIFLLIYILTLFTCLNNIMKWISFCIKIFKERIHSVMFQAGENTLLWRLWYKGQLEKVWFWMKAKLLCLKGVDRVHLHQDAVQWRFLWTCNEHSYPLNVREFVDHLSNHQLLKKHLLYSFNRSLEDIRPVFITHLFVIFFQF
jgi:hypothetical protein